MFKSFDEKRITTAILALTVFIGYTSVRAEAPATVEQALDMLESAINAVDTYDVYFVATTEANLKPLLAYAPNKPRGPGNFPSVRYVPYENNEVHEKNSSYEREVYTSDGMQRHELASDQDFDDWGEVVVFDGELRQSLHKSSLKGSVRSMSPDKKPLGSTNMNYQSLYRDLLLGGKIIDLLRQRTNVSMQAEPKGISLHTDPQSLPMYPEYGFTFFLSYDNGMMPYRIEVFRGSLDHPDFVTTVDDFMKVDDGIWVPIAATRQVYAPKNHQLLRTVTLKVDPERSSWNKPLDASLFALDFPQGTKVLDEARDIVAVVGKENVGDNIDELVRTATNIAPRDSENPTSAVLAHQQSTSWRISLIAINVLIIAAVLMMLVRKRRSLANV